MNYNEYINWWTHKRFGLILDSKLVSTHLEGTKKIVYPYAGKNKKKGVEVTLHPKELQFTVVKTI